MTDALADFLWHHRDVVAVQITQVRGSAPRENGAAMYVAQDGFYGTIGGGQVEYMAIDHARQMLRSGRAQDQMNVPLGPEIGQCCGGFVRIDLNVMDDTARKTATQDQQQVAESWPHVLIFGAGHVGRALAQALRPLPFQTRLIDSRVAELAMDGSGIAQTLTPLPEAEVAAAPPNAAYVVLTHDHALDFLIASQALARGDAAYVGMIGSATKRARFASFCRDTDGPDPAALVCPIGASPIPDKRPEVIAAMVTAELVGVLLKDAALTTVKENVG